MKKQTIKNQKEQNQSWSTKKWTIKETKNIIKLVAPRQNSFVRQFEQMSFQSPAKSVSSTSFQTFCGMELQNFAAATGNIWFQYVDVLEGEITKSFFRAALPYPSDNWLPVGEMT